MPKLKTTLNLKVDQNHLLIHYGHSFIKKDFFNKIDFYGQQAHIA